MAFTVPVILLSLPQQTLCYTWKAELWKPAEIAVGNAWRWDGPGQGSNSRGQIGQLSDVGERCPLGHGEGVETG